MIFFIITYQFCRGVYSCIFVENACPYFLKWPELLHKSKDNSLEMYHETGSRVVPVDAKNCVAYYMTVKNIDLTPAVLLKENTV